MGVLPSRAASISRVQENRFERSGLAPSSKLLRNEVMSPLLMNLCASSNVITLA